MRILFLADAGSPHTQKWVRHFARRGDEVHVASLAVIPIEEAVIHPLWRPTGTKLDYFANVGLVRRLLRHIKPDILHSHYASSYGLLGAWSGFHPLVISTWGMDVLGFPETSFLHEKLLRWNLAGSDAVCATSRQLGEATQRYLAADKIPVITPFGIELDAFSPSEARAGRKLTVGIVKSLEPKYGIEYLIRAFAKVDNNSANLQLRIVGRGSLLERFQRLAGELGVSDKTTFVGRVAPSDVPRQLAQIDIFVNPSVHESETFGVAVLEASAMKIPVIASLIGGLPEVVCDGVTGFLVPPGDVDALAKKIERLATDQNLRTQMGQAGREFVRKNYDWKENAKIMERLYASLVKSR